MKALLTGAALAAVAGVLIGAVAKPDLGWDDRPAGPQIMAGWGGGRSTGPFDDGATFASYKGQLPDFVLGTDWKRTLNPPALMAEDSRPARQSRAEIEMARNDDLPDLPVTPVTYDEPRHAAPTYPSLQGGESTEPSSSPDTPTG